MRIVIIYKNCMRVSTSVRKEIPSTRDGLLVEQHNYVFLYKLEVSYLLYLKIFYFLIVLLDKFI